MASPGVTRLFNTAVLLLPVVVGAGGDLDASVEKGVSGQEVTRPAERRGEAITEPAKGLGEVPSDILISLLTSDSFFERLAATQELCKRRDRVVLPTLLGMLDDVRPGVRTDVIEILGHMGEPSVFDPIAARLTGDSDWLVRQEAAKALARMKDLRGASLLQVAATNDDSSIVRAWAAVGLAQFPATCASGRALLLAVKDPNFQVQQLAGGVLGDWTSSSDRVTWERWVNATCAKEYPEERIPSAQAAASEPESPRDEPDPRYVAWASFKPGSWVVHHWEGLSTRGDSRTILKSVTPSEVVLEVQRTTEELGSESRAQMIPARRDAASRRDGRWKESEDVITLNGQELRCLAQRGLSVDRWFCDAIPGGFARSDMRNEMGQVWEKVWAKDWQAEE